MYLLVRNFFIAALLAAFPYLLRAQDTTPPPYTPGEIPRADLEMKSFPTDTNASAVILCDYGETTLDDDMNLRFKRYVRIKILTAKGFDFGTFSLRYNKKSKRIDDITGTTYALDSAGNIKTSELNEDDIFDEKISGNLYSRRFTMPALTPGCVIEVSYTTTANGIWNINDWTFQAGEPTRWSEYRIIMPAAIVYANVISGYERFTVNEVNETQRVFQNVAGSYLGRGVVKCNEYRWVLANAPAIRNEPFITTTADYKNRVEVQLAGYAYPGGGSEKVLSTWDKLIEEALKDREFGRFIDVTRKIRAQAEELTAALDTPEEKLKAIYDWVTGSIVFEDNGSIWARGEVNDILEKKKGNSAEITFLLLSLLKAAGIEGSPIIASTRDNGLIQETYPVVNQFNYVADKVVINDKTYFLDATDELRPMDMLPVSLLGVRGLVMRKDAVEWVMFKSDKVYRETSVANIELDEEGNIQGNFEVALKDYAALLIRRLLKNEEEKKIVAGEFETDKRGITIDSFLIAGKDSIEKPLSIKAWVNGQGYAQSSGEMLYLNPHFVNRNETNPFQSTVRKFPVDFAYPRQYSNVVNISLPEGYEVKEKVKDRDFAAADGAVGYRRRVLIEEQKIQISTVFKINHVLVLPGYYPQIRDFFGRVADSEAEQFVISKIQKPEPLPPPPSAEVQAPESQQKEPVKSETPKKQKPGKPKK